MNTCVYHQGVWKPKDDLKVPELRIDISGEVRLRTLSINGRNIASLSGISMRLKEDD